MSGYLQFGNNIIDLVEWFIASAAIIVVVSLVYVFILNKSPPPEGLTEAKLEQAYSTPVPRANLVSAQDALGRGDNARAVQIAVGVVSESLASLLTRARVDTSDMNVSDMAYLVQSKGGGTTDITQPIYQLNMLHLKAVQLQPISQQEADWAINTANWISQLISSQQIRA